ncbi:MAG: DUF4236 domain-containing protein [Alphaproteobacteria bacterium]|nr:DUF4236 domain-containing protein [Alphaproteobacteria bacterium]
MGIRFRKSFSIIPGVKINLSKSGPSVSVGGPGMTYNIGTKGSRETVGLPGSGLSYQEKSGKAGGKNGWFGIVVLIAAIGYAVFKNLN